MTKRQLASKVEATNNDRLLSCGHPDTQPDVWHTHPDTQQPVCHQCCPHPHCTTTKDQ